MKIINCTPHKLTIYRHKNDNIPLEVLPSGNVARCAVVNTPQDGIPMGYDEIQVNRATYGVVSGLPDPEPDTIYVVSMLALSGLAGSRPDCYSPGEAVRDASGQIVGCIGLNK